MWPVPATLQTLAVLLRGALGGSRLGVASVALLSRRGRGRPAGLRRRRFGPDGLRRADGRLSAGLPAGRMDRGQAGRGALRQGAMLTAAHLVLFIPGVAWLAGFVGLERAMMAGFMLFLPGTAVKTALAFAVMRAVRRG